MVRALSYFVYVLESLGNGERYVGMTSKPVEVRLQEHNSGSNKWTRANRPFKLLHSEPFESHFEATAREKFLKSGAGRKIRDALVGD